MRQYLNKKRTGIIEKFLGCKLADLDLGAGKSTKASISVDINKEFRPDIVADVQCLPIRHETFDSVICSHVIEHVEDLNRAIDEMKRVLRKNGIAIFFLPDDGSMLWRILRPFWTIYYETAVSRQDSPKSHVHSFDLERFGKTFGKSFELLEVGKINFGMEIYAICKHPLIGERCTLNNVSVRT